MVKTLSLIPMDEVPSGTMKVISVAGITLAIIHTNDAFYAIDDTCSHEKCSLGEAGILDETRIICGCHGASFDIRTGKVLSLPATKDIHTYPVFIENNMICISYETQ